MKELVQSKTRNPDVPHPKRHTFSKGATGSTYSKISEEWRDANRHCRRAWYLPNGDFRTDGVLWKGWASHEVENVFSFASESSCSIRHQSFALHPKNEDPTYLNPKYLGSLCKARFNLSCANLDTEVSLWRFAELAVITLWGVEWNDMVSCIHKS